MKIEQKKAAAWLAVALAAVFATLAIVYLGIDQDIWGKGARVAYFSILCFGTCIIVWSPGLILANYFRNWPDSQVLVPALVIFFSALMGWLIFWAWFVSPVVGAFASAALLLFSVIGLLRRPASLRGNEISNPLIFSLLLAVFYLCIAGDQGHLEEGGMQIAHRYWVSVDNVIPKMFADNLLIDRTKLLTNPIGGDWNFSDRPPLQTGIILPLYSLGSPLTRPHLYVLLGLAVNSLWIFGLWGFLRALGVKEWRIALIILSTAVVGAIYINTIYAWPKMLAAALSFSAAMFLMVKKVPVWVAAAMAGSSAALALLAHGGAAFGLIGFVFLVIPALRAWRVKGIFIAAIVAVSTYAPWMGYQKVFDPPGDRLVKWHLGGTSIDTLDTRPPLRAIAERYKEFGLAGTIANKATNLRTLLGIPRSWGVVSSQPGWDEELIGKARQLLSQFLGPAPGILLVGIFLMFFIKPIRYEAWFTPIKSVVWVSGLAYILIEFGSPGSAVAWLHTAPYTLLLLWTSLGALVLTSLNKVWAAGLLTVHFLSSYLLWVYNLAAKSALSSAVAEAPDVGMTVGALVTMALMLALALLMILGRDRSSVKLVDADENLILKGSE